MSTSQNMSLSSVISRNDEPIALFEAGYLTAAARDEAYETFFGIFNEERQLDPRITRAFLARRTRKSPEQITRYLGSAGNWTIDTYALLCAALGYRAVIRAEKICDMRPENVHHDLLSRHHHQFDPLPQIAAPIPWEFRNELGGDNAIKAEDFFPLGRLEQGHIDTQGAALMASYGARTFLSRSSRNRTWQDNLNADAGVF